MAQTSLSVNDADSSPRLSMSLLPSSQSQLQPPPLSQHASSSQPPSRTEFGTLPQQENDDLSMSSMLLAPLNELQALSQTLFLSLAPAQNKPPPPPPVSAFLACDQTLANAVNLAQQHQIKQRKIEDLEAEILELDSKWREICSELDAGKKQLEAIIREGDVRMKAIEDGKKAAIPYPELLAYAQSISAFTSAPPNMPDLAPGQPPPPLFYPPFPNEEKMRRGKLNAEAPLPLLGEAHSVGRPATVSPKGPEPSHHIIGLHPYRQDQRVPHPQEFDLDLDLNPDL